MKLFSLHLPTIAVALVVATLTGPAAAQSSCVGYCKCPCYSDAVACEALCATGYVGYCRDSTCGSIFSPECCCIVIPFLPRPEDCGLEQSCGDFPVGTCADTSASNPSTRHLGPRQRSTTAWPAADQAMAGPLSREACSSLLQLHPDEDQWAYVERIDPEDLQLDLAVVRFASHPDYQEKLQECANLGLALRENERTHLYFRPARGHTLTRGREIRVAVPKAAVGGLTGAAAVSLTMGRDGEIQDKRLVFSTSPVLGTTVLEELDRWLDIRSQGEGDAFYDVLYFRFENGKLQMLFQNHFKVVSPS